MKATEFLKEAEETISARGDQYDAKDGERSMGTAVAAFNLITRRNGDRELTEAEGWLFMQILKDVRQWQNPGHYDSALDAVAYAALKAEALMQDEGTVEESEEIRLMI